MTIRIIAMGSEALLEGFALLGVETLANPTPEQVEELLGSLIESDGRALVFLEHKLAQQGGTALDRIRREGGRIVISEIPPLQSPADYRPPVEDLVLRVLGSAALERQE
ncbi:MAG: V-type ATP synthase subunit F [Thermoanaerobaculia bacterium]|nr:V-type ATP synthase subunit F [Thermoanaerobaculia bacterium]